MLATRQQTLKPLRVPAGFDPYHHRPSESLVESSCFLGMQQPALHQRARFLVQHGYHLKARMKVTTYILHMRPPSSRALGHKQIEFTRDDLGAVVVIQSSEHDPELAKGKCESKDPDTASFAMLRQGVLPTP